MNRDTVEEFWDETTIHSCLGSVSNNSVAEFENRLGSFLNPGGRLLLTKSGSDALELFLRASSRKNKNSVLICSFNCKLVAAAVINAGLQVGTFDLAECFGRIDWELVLDKITNDTLAIVVPHFFGVPVDFQPIRYKCSQLGVLIIEDCCHTLGGRIGDKMVGSVGDAAIFSFNYDKPISLGGGGALLLNNDSLQIISSLGVTAKPSIDQEIDEINVFISYLREHRDNIPKINFLWRVYRKIEPLKRPAIGEIGSFRATLGLWQLDHYKNIISIRNKNAETVAQAHNIKSWYVGTGVAPAWLKQKILPSNPRQSKSISNKLRRMGIRVGNYNWSVTIDKMLGLKEPPNAAYVANYSLEIPIHQNMREHDLDLIKKEISES